ncbi:MAG: EAL domain-containing protein [Arenimonas sp.]|uniref:EAL domain-containing protein n=1 Tax=Arenimonas sp. TaxID=1872635 RepID=UPI0025C68FA9|nr:EAL domain-containing protein [Arenimonas sp.]MBW8366565.1 EAL domain-containing protein [Arenimonas sp.]
MSVDAITVLGTAAYGGMELRSPLRHDESDLRKRRQRASSARSVAARAEATAPLPRPLTVLLIDRDDRSRQRLQSLLAAEGFATCPARTLEDAQVLLDKLVPDLVLLNPGRGCGSEASQALKDDPRSAGVPVMLVLARLDGRTRTGSILAGAQEFIRRPVNRHVLALRIRNLVELVRLRAAVAQPPELQERAVRQRNSELERFRSAMEGAADAIFLIDRSTMGFVEVNQTACNLLGYTREELFSAGPGLVWLAPPQELEDEFDAIIAAGADTGPVDARMRHKQGALVDVEIHQQAQRWGEDWLVVGIVRDITERKQAEESLHHLAHYDTLTGLPNRALFYATLERTVAQATSHDWGVAVLFIDLDNFKSVNDTLGHAIGDELLSQLGNRLVKCVRTRDVIGRLGGDEFALILVMNDCRSGAALVACKVRAALQAPFRLMGHDVMVTASIGITIYPDDAQDATTLLRYADMAMYRAKQSGRDAACFFTAQMNVDLIARMELESALRAAVDNGEFVLNYQPKMALGDDHITGVEALLRWQRPGHGLVGPQDFVTVLEETGLIVAVGRNVIRAACRQIAQWLHSSVGPVQIAVNISARQFTDGNLAQDVRQALDESGIPAHLLELELTESSLMENTERTVDTLTSLKAMGLAITIDDFGTGYSSLAYLRRFPIDKLKIDIAFIRDITTSPDDATIALAIITMAHSLKLTVIAEGVETMEQLTYLRRHRCDQIQGYLFSRPLPPPEMEWMLLDRCRAPTPLEAALRLQFPPEAG